LAPLGYVEILDGRGNVIARTPVESFPVTIGRAYTNQVIVSDPYVCPMHLSLAPDEQGRLMARDLDSVNGLRDGKGERVTHLEIHSGTVLRIGHTWLRYCSVDHPLAATAVDRSEKVSRLVSSYAAAGAGVIALAVLCLQSFFASIERVTVLDVVGEPLAIIATMLAWAGLWALASRLMLGRLHFAPHATIVFTAFLILSVWTLLAEWSEFLIPAIPIMLLAGVLGYGLVLAGLVYGHLCFASALGARTRLWAALAVSLAVVGLNSISYIAARSKFSNVMEFSSVLKPIDAALLPAISVDRFIDASQNLHKELDRLAQKAKATQP
jgi:hypothetical protein